MRAAQYLFPFIGLFFVQSCTTVPSLEHTTGAPNARLFTHDVVKRIKCELTYAFIDKVYYGKAKLRRDDIRRKYLWVDDWTIKADLTLEVNEQGAISPSGSYTHMQQNAVNASAGPTTSPGTTLGTVAQFFTLAANANLAGQAVRAEVVSMSFSLKELDDWRRSSGSDFRENCAAHYEAGMLGHLGLREWIDAALSPVLAGDLLAGKHPAPGAAAKPSLPATVAPPKLPTGAAAAVPSASERARDDFDKLSDIEKATWVIKENELIDGIQKALTTATDSVKSARSSVETAANAYIRAEQNSRDIMALNTKYLPISTSAVKNSLEKSRQTFDTYYRDVTKAREGALKALCGDNSTFDEFHDNNDSCVMHENEDAGAEPALEIVKGLLAAAKAAQQKHDLKLLTNDLYPKASSTARSSEQFAKIAEAQSSYAQKLASMTPSTAPDPPLDSVGHTVQFLVAFGAGISPSWTLIQWKGPGLNGPSASVTINRTHLLQLALGKPQEQSRIIQNQVIFLSTH
jgi:hypothetical protein